MTARTGNSFEDIVCRGWSNNLPIAHEKQIGRCAFRDMAVFIQENRLVMAVTPHFINSQNAVDIGAANLGPAWNGRIFDAPPGRDARLHAFLAGQILASRKGSD